jgi:phosphatidylinositol alpha-1,6-mannosyltransferase
VHVVPNAVDLDRFHGVAAERGESVGVSIAGAPPLPDDAFLLVTVGRQVRRKGFAWFIEHVMPKLPNRVIFWLAGDGPERENIEAAIDRVGLRQRVRCLGKISEVELVELYRRGQLFIMPNIEGVNGWLAPSANADAFAARIQSLLDDPDGLREASKRAAEYVTSTFRWDRTAERYLEVLRAL